MNRDLEIDLIARAMTDGEPSADFRSRVLAALPTALPRWRRAVWPILATASLALVGLMVTTAGHSRPAIGTVSRVAEVASAPLAPVVPVVGVVPTVAAHRRPAVSADELAWRARAVPPLPAADPLELASIQPTPLSIAPITVEPMTSEPIVLPAIDMRNPGRH